MLLHRPSSRGIIIKNCIKRIKGDRCCSIDRLREELLLSTVQKELREIDVAP